MADDIEAPSVDDAQNTTQPSDRLKAYWREIEAYNKASRDWREQAEKIVKLYLDQHRTSASPRRFALLWSNIETMKPAIYARLPIVQCSRRYKDPDPVGRVAAEVLERASNCSFDLYNVDEVFRMVRDDRLLAARGQAWVRYEANLTKATDGYDKLSGEKVCVDYVHWRDFGHCVAGTWNDVWLVWRRVFMCREDVTKRFSAKIASQLTYETRTDADARDESGEKMAAIYELWDKRLRKTVFISRDVKEIIEDGDPPIDFRDFFPCPEPCYGSKTGKSLIPTPDYRYYQDQANEIDDLTDKIANLTEFLQVRAFVPAGPSADGSDAVRIMIQSLQSQITANKSVFIPVESWAGFAEKGGASKLVDWLPIDMVIKALQGAVETRAQLIQDVYQITGIADILRGQTDPNETLGAQELKAQTGARRIKNAKDELARFCRDIARLVAEVIAEQFQPQTIADMTGYAYVPSPPMAPGMLPQPVQPAQSPSEHSFDDRVIQLLRSDRMRGFLIDIETDSTIQPDEDAQKQRATEFVTAVGGYLSQAESLLSNVPQAAPLIADTLKYVARQFRAGRGLEGSIDEFADAMKQMAAQPKPPDPEQMKAQVDAQMNQGKLQLEQQRFEFEQQKAANDAQLEQQRGQFEVQQKQMQAQIDAELEWRKAQLQALTSIEVARIGAKTDMDSEQLSAELEAALQLSAQDHEKELAGMQTDADKDAAAQSPRGQTTTKPDIR